MIYGMDEKRNMRKKELAKLEDREREVERQIELEVARERARLSVLKLTEKDKAFLRAVKVKG